MKKLKIFLVSTIFLGFAQTAFAVEGGVTPYPIGVTSTFIGAFPPIPGIFLMEQTSVTHSTNLYDNKGNKLNFPTYKGRSISTTPRILINWPITLPGGGKIHSEIVPPIVFLHTNIEGQKATTSGMSNIDLSPIIISYNFPHHLSVGLGLDIMLPTGAYSATKASVATGYTTYSPAYEMVYNNPQGADIGVLSRLFINNKNSRTNYQSGTGIDLDYIAAWNFGPLEIGINGGYYTQLGNDSQYGKSIGNKDTKILTAGPIVQYNGVLGKIPYLLNINYQFDAVTHNTGGGNTLWVNIGIPLYVAG